MNCSGVKEHLVDFLYEEMTPDLRAAFTEHVRGCPACKAEVASYGRTLGNARAALSGPLATEPPARVHDAVMKAAAAAAAKAAQPAHKPREARTADSSEPGFFARLLRTPWLLPAFGAASVATVVFLVRVIKNPEVIPGQRAHPIEERTEIPHPASARGEHAAAAEKAAPAETEHAWAPPATEMTGRRGDRASAPRAPEGSIRKGKQIADHPLAGLDLEERTRQESTGAAAQARPSEKKKLESAGGSWRDGAGSGSANRFAAPPPPRRAPTAVPAADERGRGPTKETSSPGAAPKDQRPLPAQAKKSGHLDSLLGDFGSRTREAEPTMARPEPGAEGAAKPASAIPPAPLPSAAPSPAPPTVAQPMPARNDVSIQSGEAKRATPARSHAPTAGAVAASKPAAAAKAASIPRQESGPPAEASPQAAYEQQSDDKMPKGQPGPSLDESVRRADRLFADGHWAAAAQAYRDLLRRFPDHRDAGKWRARVDQALVAERERQVPAAKAAKARAADVDSTAASKQ